mgnify:CR=1 FL=1
MVAGLLGRRLMVGVDRLDYSKGLVERFRAYERFLETHPENQNRVTFLQIAPLSRTDVRGPTQLRMPISVRWMSEVRDTPLVSASRCRSAPSGSRYPSAASRTRAAFGLSRECCPGIRATASSRGR